MSEESKPKTMIGTVAPITRPPTQSGHAHQRPITQSGAVPPPSRSGLGSAAPPPAAPPMSSHAAATFIAPAPPMQQGGAAHGAQPMPAGPYGSQPMPSMPLVTSAPTAGAGPAQLAAWATPSADALVGQVLCGYRIRRKLAEGGMGVVYEGVHDTLGRTAAIKVLKPELCQSEEVIERFHQEARAVNSIRHENIVDIYDFGRDDFGRVFFVMEYLEGEPLSSRLRRGPLSWGEAFPILDQTLRALKAAHEKGFVHRDLKPDNLWLRQVDGKTWVKLLDFGIAKLVGGDEPREKLTQTGSIIGTPHYMSPEQINGARDIDQRTDLYAMGIILYEMFTGATPFGGDTLQAIMTGHLFKEAPRLAELPPMLGVPPPVAEIVERMLAKDPASRYESAAQVLSDLHDIHRHQRPAHASSLHHTKPLRQASMAHLPAMASAPAPAPAKRKGKGLWVAAGLIGAGAVAAVVVLALRNPGPGETVSPGPAGATGTTAATGTTVASTADPAVPAPPALDTAEVRSQALGVLEQALSQGEPLVRKDGARAVGRVKHEPALPKLLELTEKDVDLPVRGEAATAIATLEARSALRLLSELEKAAPPELSVWYTAAVARLGDASAVKRLLKQSKHENLAIAFPAAMALGELAKPGDRKALAALRSVVVRSSEELDALVPLLSKMAVLRDPDAQQNLVQLLSHPQERAQLAAAEGLARLGDDAGRELLAKMASNSDSPNRLHAAAAQVLLGEYTGIEVLGQALEKGALEEQLVAARALGDIGQKESLAALWALVQRNEAHWRLRVAAAAAAVQIVGLDPKLLASASVDWTKNALASEDWVTRHAAAGVLSDLPAQEAVPLLARAIADKEKSVRLRASRSARKIRTPEAAREVIAAVKNEQDPEVREEQVVALGEIGQAEAQSVLTELTQEPGRVGVLAAGSLVAVGDDAGVAKLEAAIKDRATPMRLAAVQAAVVAKKDVVIPTLKVGAADSVFDVQLGAAEGLSLLRSEQALAVPILEEAMRSRNTATVARGLVALTRFGVAPKDATRTPAELVNSADPAQRLAAVPVVQEMPLAEGLPLLRRLLADPDRQVRRASVEAVEAVARSSKDQAIRLYKPLVQDPDDFIRSKASGQLSRLVEAKAPVAPAPAAAPPPPSPAAPPPAPATTDDLPKVQTAAAEAAAAFAKVSELLGKSERRVKEVSQILADKASDDADQRAKATLDELEQTQAAARGSLRELEQAVAALEAAAGAGPSPEAAALLATAREQRTTATAQLEALEKDLKKVDKEVDALASVDVSTLLRTARLALGRGKLGQAERDLGEVAQALKKSGGKNADYELLVGQLHYSKADFTSDPTAKRKALGKAREAYQRAATLGKRSEAQKMLSAIDEDLAALGP